MGGGGEGGGLGGGGLGGGGFGGGGGGGGGDGEGEAGLGGCGEGGGELGVVRAAVAKAKAMPDSTAAQRRLNGGSTARLGLAWLGSARYGSTRRLDSAARLGCAPRPVVHCRRGSGPCLGVVHCRLRLGRWDGRTRWKVARGKRRWEREYVCMSRACSCACSACWLLWIVCASPRTINRMRRVIGWILCHVPISKGSSGSPRVRGRELCVLRFALALAACSACLRCRSPWTCTALSSGSGFWCSMDHFLQMWHGMAVALPLARANEVCVCRASNLRSRVRLRSSQSILQLSTSRGPRW